MIEPREFSAGSRDSFAFKVALRPDPEEMAGATQEQSFSWGSFEIWVNGQNLCSHLEDGEPVASVHWYLLPLLEWLTANWDFLLHEERLPGSNAKADAWGSLLVTAEPPLGLAEQAAEAWESRRHGWWRRHCLLACRDGGLFPNVVVRRWQHLIEFSWGPGRPAGAPSHYRFEVNQDFARFPPEEVAQVLYAVLSLAVQHLRDSAADSPRFEQLAQDVARIRREGAGRRVALLATLGNDISEAETAWQTVEALFPRELEGGIREAVFGQTYKGLVVRGSCQAGLMFGTVSPTIDLRDAALLAGKLISLYAPGGDPPSLRPFVRLEPLEKSEELAWRQGYRLAEEFMDALPRSFAEAGWVEVDKIYQGLNIRVEDIPLQDRAIRAVAIAGPHHQPSVLVNLNHEGPHERRRFTLAHELCHILYDRGYGAGVALASGPWAPVDIERRANAFAAMLLMPSELVRRAVRDVGEPIDAEDKVLAVARRLRTSFTATLEHLTNLGFISEVVRDAIRLAIEPRPTPGS